MRCERRKVRRETSVTCFVSSDWSDEWRALEEATNKRPTGMSTFVRWPQTLLTKVILFCGRKDFCDQSSSCPLRNLLPGTLLRAKSNSQPYHTFSQYKGHLQSSKCLCNNSSLVNSHNENFYYLYRLFGSTLFIRSVFVKRCSQLTLGLRGNKHTTISHKVRQRRVWKLRDRWDFIRSRGLLDLDPETIA